MDNDLITGIAVFLGLVVIAAAAVVVFREHQRGDHPGERSGPEHGRGADRRGRGRADRDLHGRRSRRSASGLRDLAPEERARYEDEWARTQERFVDDPVAAVDGADRLTARVMADRGYPVDGADRRSAELPAEHAEVVDDYRRAHESAERGRTGAATTEELRDAMVRYRALFAELLGHTARGEQPSGRHAVPAPRDSAERDPTAATGRHRR